MEKPEREPLDAVVNVAQLLSEPVGSIRTSDMDGMIGQGVDGFVQVKARLIRTSRGVLVQCKLAVETKLECSRCLDTFLCSVSFAAEEEFLPVLDPPGNAAPWRPEQTEEFIIDGKNILDLSELIRQYTLLNLPMKPLCRPECPGIKEANSHGIT